jgi:hypothetical protein
MAETTVQIVNLQFKPHRLAPAVATAKMEALAAAKWANSASSSTKLLILLLLFLLPARLLSLMPGPEQRQLWQLQLLLLCTPVFLPYLMVSVSQLALHVLFQLFLGCCLLDAPAFLSLRKYEHDEVHQKRGLLWWRR